MLLARLATCAKPAMEHATCVALSAISATTTRSASLVTVHNAVRKPATTIERAVRKSVYQTPIEMLYDGLKVTEAVQTAIRSIHRSSCHERTLTILAGE